jgi:hypothetical protein
MVCSHDDCWRAFRVATDWAETSLSSWCTDLLVRRSQCTYGAPEEMPGIDPLVSMQCTQAAPCQVIASACACYTAGEVNWDSKPRRRSFRA